jgi:hypothetical protein
MLLPFNLAEVVADFTPLAEEVRYISLIGRDLQGAVQEIYDLGEFADPDHLDALNDSPLINVLDGNDDAGKTSLARGDCDREAAAHRLHAAVQRELAQEDVARKLVSPDGAGGRQDSDGDRQVEGRPLLLHVGGGEVHGDFSVGEFITGVLERGLDPVLALLHSAVGKSDRRELREPLGDIHLDVDDDGVDTEKCAGEDLGEHETSPMEGLTGMVKGYSEEGQGFAGTEDLKRLMPVLSPRF